MIYILHNCHKKMHCILHHHLPSLLPLTLNWQSHGQNHGHTTIRRSTIFQTSTSTCRRPLGCPIQRPITCCFSTKMPPQPAAGLSLGDQTLRLKVGLLEIQSNWDMVMIPSSLLIYIRWSKAKIVKPIMVVSASLSMGGGICYLQHFLTGSRKYS